MKIRNCPNKGLKGTKDDMFSKRKESGVMKIMKKMIAMLIATCMVMSLFGVNAFAEEAPDVQAPAYRCQREEHTHTDACYTTLICGKVAHGEECYTEGVKTCENHEVTRTLICELHVHEDACYHVHSAVGGECRPLNCQDSGEPTCGKTEETVECELTEGHTEHNETCARHQHVDGCYHQHSEACYPLTCGKTEETLVCEIVSDHVHDDTCYEEHVHSRDCYVAEPDCGKIEHTHDDSCIPPSYNYYTNPVNENINLTLYNYGSYINVGEDKSLQFGWHNDLASGGRPYEGIDGPAMKTDGTVFTS